ncbi:MAG: hypothetical protein H0U16_03975 [Actinobacteria bacterium]|nr:hypothetical protein [Actinomycetota bacterium]
MRVTAVAHGIGKGLVAGLAGTAAMTLSSTIEAKVRGRPASSAPAKAAERALGIEKFGSDAAERRFGTLVHWGYGIGWGAVRGLLRAAGASSEVATAGHFAAIWGSAQVTLPVLDVAPPIAQWGGKEIAIDAWHHLVYTVATGAAYELLDGRP